MLVLILVSFFFKGNAFTLDGASSQVSAELKLNSRLDFDEGIEIYNLTIKATVSIKYFHQLFFPEVQ